MAAKGNGIDSTEEGASENKKENKLDESGIDFETPNKLSQDLIFFSLTGYILLKQRAMSQITPRLRIVGPISTKDLDMFSSQIASCKGTTKPVNAF